jgi:hypothetical protein
MLQSKNMFANQASDVASVSRYVNQIEESSQYSLGWSFNVTACSLFDSLAADSIFYQKFYSSSTDDFGKSSKFLDTRVSQLSSCHVGTYVHSKILPSACGSVEHMNIMYWTDRFHMCATDQDARSYDESKKIERRVLIWPYLRSQFDDVNQFCSFISLYIYQVSLC